MTQTADRHHRLRAVFDGALLQDSSARAAYLDAACRSDPALKPDVMRLLALHDDASTFLERPPDLSWPAVRAEAAFPGTERFHVLRRLGAGGMGVVYEVRDLVRDEIVALKTLVRTSAADVYRLKREFRSLADVAHPNLVCLYELFVEEERCFFTMALVRGMSFVDYARAPAGASAADDRLRDALRQLIEGVSALHRSGKLHRDLKPSNILVTPEGRVVILDFGLIAELRPQHAGDVHYVTGGTPAYMPPEDGWGVAPSEAGDWYGVGVTFYEALTGRIPFAGPLLEVLQRKTADDPPTPAQLVPSVAPDLNAICMGLLHRLPEQRLSGLEALRRLACDGAPAVSEAPAAAAGDAPFIGRHQQLQTLNDALVAVMNGAATARCVHGPSGIGKSALVRRFLSQFATRDDVVVLAGRCYENESVPYKALDGVVDDLSRYLRSLPRRQVESLLPADVPALARVFPVLLLVDGVNSASLDREPGSIDPLALRRRAFEALRELLRQVASRRALVVAIDDLQWADADSVLLLEELLRPPSAPAMLTVLCFRSEEAAAKPFLAAMLGRETSDAWSAIALQPMTDEEAGRLIARLLPSESTLTDHEKRRMTGEAGGSPFVLEQLARYAGVQRTESRGAPTFARMFEARLGALSVDARRFLQTLAICGRPVAPALVCDACGVEGERQSLVAMLRSSRFIRSSGSSDSVETYHDRIREVLAAQVSPGAVRRIHGRMAHALVGRRSDDCEALFEHYRGAGDHMNAARQAGVAAAKAATALAFDRAAFFYGQALALSPAAPAAAAWREGSATALANAGWPAEAAEAYLLAAAGAEGAARIELQRRAAEQFLIGGHIDRGRDLIRQVLASVGIRPARSLPGAIVSLWSRRAQLRWRGLRFVSRPAGDIDRDALLRVDTCWSAATGLAMVDMIGTSAYSVRHLLMALDAGEPSRIARGMALESAGRSACPVSRTWSKRLVEQATSLARNSGQPQAIATCLLAEAIAATTAGEWKKALAASDEAVPILRDRCIGVTWEVSIAQSLGILALMYLGELGEVSRRVPPLLAHARSRGNLYLATELCTRSNYAWLAADQADQGEREVIESIARWSHKGFQRQHYSALLARVQTALYRGDGAAAWRLLAEQEPLLRRSYLTCVQLIRIEWQFMRARSALMLAATSGDARHFLSIAGAAARRIARDRMPWSDPIASLLQAGIASVGRNRPLALGHLHDALVQFDRADMQLFAAVTRRRIGAVQDDPSGHELQRQAETWMAGQNIKNPAAITRMLAPGFPDN